MMDWAQLPFGFDRLHYMMDEFNLENDFCYSQMQGSSHSAVGFLDYS